MAKTKEQREAIRREGRKQFVKGVKQQLQAGAQIAPTVLAIGGLGRAISGASTIAETARAVGSGLAKNKLAAVAGVGGLANAGKAIKTKIEGDWNRLAGLAKWIFNHPEWYDRFEISTNSLNYSYRTTNIIDTLNDVDPLFSQAVTINYEMVEASEIIESQVAIQSVQANLLSLRRARGFGYSNYTVKDLSNYMRNIRLLAADLAESCRLIKLFNNYDITNTKMPYALFAAADSTYLTQAAVDAEYNNLANYKHELLQLINLAKVNALGAFPLLDRTVWLASNIFSDTKGRKTIAYVPRLTKHNNSYAITTNDGTEIYAYYDSSMTMTNARYNHGGTIATRMNNIRTLINNAFVNDPVSNQISSDLLYLYGESASQLSSYLGHLINTIEDPVVMVHDEYLLSQVQNTHVMGYTKKTYEPTNNNIPGYIHDHFVTPSDGYGHTFAYGFTQTQYANNPASRKHRWKEFYVANTTLDPKSISMGMQVSMLRLQEYIPTNNEYYMSIDAGNNSYSSIYFGIYNSGGATTIPTHKSEVVTYVGVVTSSGTNTFTETPVIFPGNVCCPVLYDVVADQTYQTCAETYDQAMRTWGLADWMPRIICPVIEGVDTSGTTIAFTIPVLPCDPEVFLWDINQYAPYSPNEVAAMDQDAVQSLYVWTWNGDNLLSNSIKTVKTSKVANSK